jgi:archaetidylinositol phosphate synthase
MLTKLKQKVQGWLAVEAKLAHSIGLTPNGITIVGALLAFSSSVSYAWWQANIFFLPIASILLLLSGFGDALDGIVARLYGQATVFGGFLDSLLDRYADAVVLVGLIYGGLCDMYWGILAIVGCLLVSYSRARAESAGLRIETIGVAERAERILIIAIAGFVSFFWFPTNTMNVATILLAILTNLTVLQRTIFVYNKLKKKNV